MGFNYAPYAKAATLYRPANAKLLIIQEAPPYALERHFYFTDVRAHDSLWVNFTRYAYKKDFGEDVAAAGLPLVNEEALPFPGRGQ